MGTPSSDLGTVVRLDEVLAGLSVALDLVEGQPMGHAGRCALIAQRFAVTLGLSAADRETLLHAALLKDSGCSSNAARIASLFGADDREVKGDRARLDRSQRFAFTRYLIRHTRPHATLADRAKGIVHVLRHARHDVAVVADLRCRAGAEVVAELGLGGEVTAAIRALDERFDGAGVPDGLVGEQIPLLTRVVQIAQTAEVWASIGGPRAARGQLRRRAGTLLDPRLVTAFDDVIEDRSLWRALDGTAWRAELDALCDDCRPLLLDRGGVEQVARVFAGIVDRKSPYTARHSERVARIADAIAVRLGVPESQRRQLRCAALLHDIGKLGVSNTVLDAPRKLTSSEWAEMRHHVDLTYEILRPVGVFAGLAQTAAAHHERLDGTGYNLGLHDEQLSRDVRILAVADCYEALTALRPYREPASPAGALAILTSETPTRCDPEVVGALSALVADGDPVTLGPVVAAAA